MDIFYLWVIKISLKVDENCADADLDEQCALKGRLVSLMILCTESKTNDIEAEIRQLRTPLDDKFDIVEKIGTGGLANMWQIFRAFDRQSGH
uniref:Uncharacterized protein n=1 Tax=Romanomermis culicivorax TaxID=13658 RepID=A0A915JGC9_ROMCU